MKNTIYIIDDEYGIIAKGKNFKNVLSKWINREIKNILQTFIEDDEDTAKEVVCFLKNYHISKKVSPYFHFRAISSIISVYEDVEHVYNVKYKEEKIR